MSSRSPVLILCAAVFFLADTSQPCANAGDVSDLVVLLHPKMKDWKLPIANAPSADKSNSWGFFAYHPLRRPEMSISDVRLEVGDSFKKVDDWSMMVQFSAPAFGLLPDGLGPGVAVPFVVRYRESADAKPIEVARGTVTGQGATYALAVERIFQARIRGINEALTFTQGSRVFADKTIVDNGTGIPYTFAPVTVDLKAKPPTASVHVHNKFPVPVGVFLEFQSKFKLGNGDQYFEVGRNERGEPVPLVVESGEKKTVTIELKELRPGQEPRWCKLIGIYLMNPTDGPKKKP